VVAASTARIEERKDMFMHPHHFDALPLHPQPESGPPESYTGYMIRLAEENHIFHIRDITAIFFPNKHNNNICKIGDAPPASFGALPIRAVCSEERLLRTTLYHAARKFGRSIKPSPLGRSLVGCVAPHLRYCPPCIAERGYYALPWRFLWVDGCPLHGCALLDRCGHCGNTIKLLPSLLKIGICPTCRGNLRTCRARPLRDSERRVAEIHWGEAEWLVSPHPCEQDPEGYLKDLGQRLVNRREECGDTREAMAAALSMSPHILSCVEGTKMTRPGVPMGSCVRYAHHIGVDLRDPVTAPTHGPLLERSRSIRVVARRAVYVGVDDDDVVRCVRDAIKVLPHPTIGTIAVAIHVAQGRLMAHDAVVEILLSHGIAMPRRLAYEEETLEWVERTIEEVRSRETLSVVAVSRAMGRSTSWLYLFPRVRARLQRVVRGWEASRETRAETRGDAVIERVLSVIDELEAAGTYATLDGVSAHVGLHKNTLREYPRVRPILAKLEDERRRRIDDELDRRDQEAAIAVAAAVGVLRSQADDGRLPSRRAVSRFMGVPLPTMYGWPRTKAALDRIWGGAVA